MSSNLLVHAKSTISEESKASSLAEEVVRRCPSSRKVEMVERLCTKIKTSGHTDKFIRKVILRGLTNYSKKLKKSFLKVGEPGY